MATADSKLSSSDDVITDKEHNLAMVTTLTPDDDILLKKKNLVVQYRHKGLVDALNIMKSILLKEKTPAEFFKPSIFNTLERSEPATKNIIINAIYGYNNAFEMPTVYQEKVPTGPGQVQKFYNDNKDLMKSIPPKVIQAYSLDEFENLARLWENKFGYRLKTEYELSGQYDRDYNLDKPWTTGGRKRRSSKKRTKSAKRKSATKRRRHRRRTSRK